MYPALGDWFAWRALCMANRDPIWCECLGPALIATPLRAFRCVRIGCAEKDHWP